MIERLLTHQLRQHQKSVLLLGPRQTGKSTLFNSFQPDLTINLAFEPTYLEFMQNPYALVERLNNNRARHQTVFIDEIQRLPSLTNTIQTVLDKDKNLRFFLTGSSARKLRRSEANLLPGRILSYHLYPLTASEIGENFQLNQALGTGTLPGIYTRETAILKKEILMQYAGTYLKEEVAVEGFVRNLEGFARFLKFIAVTNGEILDLSKVASEAQIKRATASRFFEILEDTLIIKRCPAYHTKARRRLVRHPRFYFFDIGVLNGILRNFEPSDDRKGLLFESWIHNQIVHELSNRRKEFDLSFYRTENGAEVDFILETERGFFAIETKASYNVGFSDLKGFASFSEVTTKKFRKCIFYLGHEKKKIQDVDILPWQEGLQLLF